MEILSPAVLGAVHSVFSHCAGLPPKASSEKGTGQVVHSVPQLAKKTNGATKKVLQNIRVYGKQGLGLD